MKKIKRINLLFALSLIILGCDPLKINPDNPPTPVDEDTEFTLNISPVGGTMAYPHPDADAVVFVFDIIADKKLDDVKVELTCDDCLDASYELDADGMGGKISITAKEGVDFMEASASITVTSGRFRKQADMAVSLAYLRLSSNSGSVPSEGGELSFSVESNVNYTPEQDEQSKAFASISIENNTCRIKLMANGDFNGKNGTVTLKDSKGVLTTVYRFSQAGSAGSRLTDSLALVKMYNDMEGWKWKERGAFSHLTKNWCTSAPLENWCGIYTNSHTDLTTYENQHDGRVTRIFMIIIYDDDSQHELSEAIGELKMLTKIEITGLGINGKLPKSLANLPKLNYISILCSNLCDKLIDHPLQNIAGQLRFLEITGDIWGPVPEWLTFARLDAMNLSGRIPDKVSQQPDLQVITGWSVQSGWNTTSLNMINDCIIHNAKKNGYAMWYGEEQPEGVEFVPDEHEGHWKWIDESYAWKFVYAHM